MTKKPKTLSALKSSLPNNKSVEFFCEKCGHIKDKNWERIFGAGVFKVNVRGLHNRVLSALEKEEK